jgi:hypothetical protein
MSASKEYPMIVFFTNERCDHCAKFRGDGKPSDSQPWNNALIRKYLVNGSSTPTKQSVLASRIIEFHDNRGYGNKIDYIGEINLYSTIPSDVTITSDFFHDVMSDENPLFGSSILRIKLSRDRNSRVEIEVEIDGNNSDPRCEQIKSQAADFFIWDVIPIEFAIIRGYLLDKITDKDVNFSEIMESIKGDPLYEIINKEFYNFKRDSIMFDSILLTRFNFSWFLKRFVPERIRDLERYYPTWMLVLPSEWRKGKDNGNKVYAKCVSAKTILEETRYKTVDIGPEKLSDLLTLYWNGRLFLTYEEALLNESNKLKRVQFNFGNNKTAFI